MLRTNELSKHLYQVLAINAPTTTGNKVVLPGDPTSLYAAMVVLVDESLKARSRFIENTHSQEDFIPDFGSYPSVRHCESYETNEELSMTPRVPDDCIFDPRVWNEEVERRLGEFLRIRQPKVVMISNTSLGHPFAITIAERIKNELPNTIVIIGGAHEDDTMKNIRSNGQIVLLKASTLRMLLEDGKKNLFDFIISGDAEYALAFVFRIISKNIRTTDGVISKKEICNLLCNESHNLINLPGHFTLGYINEHDELTIHISHGYPIDYKLLPPIYRFFFARSRFDVFKKADGACKLTAHIITTRSCPRSCIYCSEGNAVQQNGSRYLFSCDANDSAKYWLEVIEEYLSYGVQAVFFDDSILFGGKKKKIVNFCKELFKVKKRGRIPDDFEWGAQLSVEDIINSDGEYTSDSHEMLQWMLKAGCSYVYVGVESLDETVMVNVDKHRNICSSEFEHINWEKKVERALEACRRSNIRVGVSIQFGLPGENDKTIDKTISGVGRFIRQGKIFMASPNVATYHPGTALTYLHDKARLKYYQPSVMRYPYALFEEANPDYSTILLSEKQLWRISERVYAEWQTINKRQMFY